MMTNALFLAVITCPRWVSCSHIWDLGSAAVPACGSHGRTTSQQICGQADLSGAESIQRRQEVFWNSNAICYNPLFFGGGVHLRHMEVLRLGVRSELQPQPQQHRIQATSATYTPAHSNAGSWTHWARPGIKPTSSFQKKTKNKK